MNDSERLNLLAKWQSVDFYCDDETGEWQVSCIRSGDEIEIDSESIDSEFAPTLREAIDSLVGKEVKRVVCKTT